MSNEYTDAKGRKWAVVLDVGALKRMRLLAGCRLDDILPKDIPDKATAQAAATSYADFLNDDERFSEALYAILKPQADAAGVTHEQFDEGLAGEANQRALMAFHGAFADFSQSPRKTLLRGMKLGLKKMEAQLTKLDAMTDAEIEAAMDKAANEIEALKKSVGNTPEPSELTLAS